MADYQFEKHFTLEEARALLPHLRQVFARIHEHKKLMEKAEENLEEQMKETGGDLGGETTGQFLNSMLAVREGISEVTGLGIQVKDLDRGLVDFPAIRNGREIFLCWELEEDDIEFWHDIEAGYAGRERL